MKWLEFKRYFEDEGITDQDEVFFISSFDIKEKIIELQESKSPYHEEQINLLMYLSNLPKEYSNCRKVSRYLVDYLMKTLGSTKKNLVETHLKMCSSCTRKFQMLELIHIKEVP